MNKIKVLICDDMNYLCQYFKNILSTEKDIEVAGIANSGEECLKLYAEKKPDVVLLDIQMKTEDEGISVLRSIMTLNPDAKVIMVTIHEEDELVFKALSGGACDYILKSIAKKNIIDSIRKAYNGEVSLNPIIAKKILDDYEKLKKQQTVAMSLLHSVALLTAAEYKILRMVYDGLSYSEIAEQRFVEEVTIRTQINKILKKFEKKNMKELIKELKDIQFFNFQFQMGFLGNPFRPLTKSKSAVNFFCKKPSKIRKNMV